MLLEQKFDKIMNKKCKGMVKKIVLTGNTINWPGIKQKMFLKGKNPAVGWWDFQER